MNLFTDKCKEMFEAWVTPKYVKNFYNTDVEHILKAFYELPFPMQQGVYIDFLITKEVWVEVYYKNDWQVYIATVKVIEDGFYCKRYSTMDKDRDISLTQAIVKCNELINERK